MRSLTVTGFLVLVSLAAYTDALAVMSVDLGNEFMKVAIVKPGVPMEIAINKEGRRKTPTVVSIRNGERLFSDPALNTFVRFPDRAYVQLLDLLGKEIDNPAVKLYQKRFPYYKLEADPVTNRVLFRHDEETTFSPEELIAMILQHARDIAEKFAEQSIADAVITVPAYFNQAERRAMAHAVDLAGLKLLQLMSDNTAVALQFGIFRMKEFTNVTVHHMFFDMGSAKTTVSIVAFQEVKQKNAVTGLVEKFPQLTVKGIGFDRSLGGLDFQLRLRDHFARKFNEQKKTKTDVFTNPRSMAKLFKEAGRVKNVLSANNDHHAQVESLLEDIDFKVKVSREEFEEMCSDLFDRVKKVIADAYSSSEVTEGEIAEVLLMGAGTRVPSVQERILAATGKTELGKSVNTDEAAAIGAVYNAAYLSKGFKVKKFGVRDGTVFPIEVEFERMKSDENGENSVRNVRRTLFGRNNPYPQKKVMTFNKHTKDFGFVVNYGDLDRVLQTEEDKLIFGSSHISDVALSGVGNAFTTHASVAEAKGVKAHFRMDESGILFVEKVEALFEKAPPADGEDKEESTLSKLGSTISNFFGGSEKDAEKEGDVKDESNQEPGKDEKNDTLGKDAENQQQEDEKIKTESKTENQQEEKKETEGEPAAEEVKKEEPKKEEKEEKPTEKETKEEKKKDGKKDDKEKKDDKKDAKKEEKKEKKPAKPTVIREEIKANVELKDMKEPTTDSKSTSRQKIRDLKKKDEEKDKLEKAMNDLESFVINTQSRLYEDEWDKCSTEEEKANIRTKLSEASDWLYEVEEGTGREAYEDKLRDLKILTKALSERVEELKNRPRAIDAFNSIVNYSDHFLISMKNFTGEVVGEQPFTQVEYTTLEKLIEDTKQWNKTITEEQAKTPLTEKPKVMVEDFGRKIGELDREVKYLINKAKTFKPKVKKPEKQEKNKTETASNTTKPEGDTADTQKAEETIDPPPVADGEKETLESTEDSGSEGVKMEIPPTPEEQAEEASKQRRKNKDGDKEEEILQLDESSESSSKSAEESTSSEPKEKHDGGEL